MATALQAARKAAGYKSAAAFAKAFGIPTSTYTAYEQGNISFNIEKAAEFADFLGCSIDEIAGRQSPSEPLVKEPPLPQDVNEAIGMLQSMSRQDRKALMTVLKSMSKERVDA